MADYGFRLGAAINGVHVEMSMAICIYWTSPVAHDERMLLAGHGWDERIEA
jgi:hypothetical protein